MQAATPEEARTNLRYWAEKRRLSLAQLSAALGRNAAYVQQYVERGSPRVLHEYDRLKLAQLLLIDERQLGARNPWRPIDRPLEMPSDDEPIAAGAGIFEERSMTNDDIADALIGYHEALMLMAQTMAPAERVDQARYQFRTESGAELPPLDELAAALRNNS